MKKLPVPVKLPLRWEAWRGFGKPELLRTLALFAPTTTAALLLSLVLGAAQVGIITVLTAVVSIAVGVGVFQKMDNNLSIYDYIRQMIDFSRSQQRYYYRREEVKVHALWTEEA